jgi:hypothetical protein
LNIDVLCTVSSQSHSSSGSASLIRARDVVNESSKAAAFGKRQRRLDSPRRERGRKSAISVYFR